MVSLIKEKNAQNTMHIKLILFMPINIFIQLNLNFYAQQILLKYSSMANVFFHFVFDLSSEQVSHSDLLKSSLQFPQVHSKTTTKKMP